MLRFKQRASLGFQAVLRVLRVLRGLARMRARAHVRAVCRNTQH
jgi:hypothetical protein